MIMYPELSEEMKKRHIRQKDIAQLLHLSDRGLYNKLHGLSEFTEEEVRIIQETFFPDMPTDCLFPVPSGTETEAEVSVLPETEAAKPEVGPEVKPEAPEVEAVLPETEPEEEPETEAEVWAVQSAISAEIDDKTGSEIGSAGKNQWKSIARKRKFRFLYNKKPETDAWHITLAFCVECDYATGKNEIFLYLCLGPHHFAAGLLFPRAY